MMRMREGNASDSCGRHTKCFSALLPSSSRPRSQTVRSEVGITSQPATACGSKPPAAGNLLRNWRGSEWLSLVSTSERTSTAYLQELPAACFLRKIR